MALFTPSESPAITVKEIDLSGYVPNVQTSTGAIVGNFRWGPAEVALKVGDEANLVATFASPNSTGSVDFHSAAYFLRYSRALYVVREITDAAYNAHSNTDEGAPDVTVKNSESWDSLESSFGPDSGETDAGMWIAKYPGELGNSLLVSICPVGSDSDGSFFSNWTYAVEFDAAPSTSDYVSARSGSNDEVHVAVVDQDGQFTGTPGTVLETYPFLSLASDAKTNDGSSNYIKDVINSRSDYIWTAAFDSTLTNAGDAAANTTYVASATGVITTSLANGADSGALTTTEYLTGFDLFEDADAIQVDFLIAPGMTSSIDQTTVVNDLVSTAASVRKDCIVVTSPNRDAIINSNSQVTDTVATTDNFTPSSYLVVDNNYLKVYDKYNDQYISIPAASSTAGLMALTDQVAAPFFSPAGARRGQYLGITALAYSPNKSERDTLYKAGVNPIANIPGQGVLLFGDKTKLARPSVFDRINVRRLFLAMEKAIAVAARNVMFEFNDEFTRAEFTNIVEPFLREIRGRRGITDFRVVCDETNNTPEVVDRNQFIASIFVKPARSINYVTLNFVAVRGGVAFEEVVGTV